MYVIRILMVDERKFKGCFFNIQSNYFQLNGIMKDFIRETKKFSNTSLNFLTIYDIFEILSLMIEPFGSGLNLCGNCHIKPELFPTTINIVGIYKFSGIDSLYKFWFFCSSLVEKYTFYGDFHHRRASAFSTLKSH